MKYTQIAGPISIALLLPALFLLLIRPAASENMRGDSKYQSPYRLSLTFSPKELYAPDSVFPRNDFRLESEIPYREWYSEGVRRRFSSWGPRARRFPQPPEMRAQSVDWQQQRLLAVAYSMIGLPYQHHHIPDWDPPPSWPWKKVAYGRNSKGIDCSDFTGWVYNYGLGIRMSTGTRLQADARTAETELGPLPVQTIESMPFDQLVGQLRAGDLLFIRHESDDVISHVVMWLGKFGISPDHAPLVIDCTGSNHIDCNKNRIPIGVHIRPFTQDSWYYRRFAHANRILHGREELQSR